MDNAGWNFNYGGRTVLNSYNLRFTIYECAKVKMEREIVTLKLVTLSAVEVLKHCNSETLNPDSYRDCNNWMTIERPININSKG